MKKALVVANLAGFASFLLHDMKILQQKGYQVSFAANANKMSWNDTKEEIERMGVDFIQIDFDSKNPLGKQNRSALKQLKRVLAQGQYDFIHCHTPIAGLLTRYAARKYRRRGTKVIYTTHGLSYTKNSSWKTKFIYKTIESMGSRWCDAIITINSEDYEAVQQLHCKHTYKISGVGFDYARFHDVSFDREAFRQELGIASDDIFVLAVGELSSRKNHRSIIEALALLPDKDKYVFGICGGGIEGGIGEMLQKLAEEKGVRLKLFGFRSDIPYMMHASDIGAIPSIREGLGLAGVQSLAAGVPLLGTDVQGIREYIIPGETGYLYSAFDIAGYAKGIQQLSNEATRTSMRERCYEVAMQFDIAISRTQMKKIYAEILE